MNNHNKGFTLIEILVTVSILAVVVAGLSMTINTILKTYNIARDQVIVMRQVENTGHWMTQDLQHVENPSDGSLPNLNGFPFPLEIECYSGDDVQSTETVNYQIISEDTNNKLFRTVNGGGAMLVAEYIDTDNTSIATLTEEDTGDKYYELAVAASFGGKEVQLIYTIKPRVQ
jgi:prepilin-type N-terminal cleavage/methylation domain-containing protein